MSIQSDQSLRLSAVGLISSMGCGITPHIEPLFSSGGNFYTNSNAYYETKTIPVAKVDTELSPHLRGQYNSKALDLLSVAYEQIKAYVQDRIAQYGAGRVATVLGTSTAGMHQAEDDFAVFLETGSLPETFRYGNQEIGGVVDILSLLSGVKGPRFTISTACSSGANSFISAARMIRAGIVDAAIVGGVDTLARLNIRGFDALGIVSDSGCNPFSARRNGTTLGEGAALFVMEKGETGVLFKGGKATSDAHHQSSPDPEGTGAYLAMSGLLDSLHVEPKAVSYVNLHGTGTAANDSMEAKALKRAGLQEVACSSSKPFVGHTLGAAGAIEAAFCWLSLNHFLETGKLPLPLHQYDGDFDPDIDPVNLVTSATEIEVRDPLLLSNSFGFGGANTCLAFGVGQ